MLVGMSPAIHTLLRRLFVALAPLCAFAVASEGGLEEELGRSEVRVRSEGFELDRARVKLGE